MRSGIVILFVLASLARIAFGWGKEGHEAIGMLAQQMISGKTLAKVRELLEQGRDQDLASISVWADDLQTAAHDAGPLARDPEAIAFNRRFPKNARWHFVNLPLGTRSYQDASSFTSPDDVVQAIRRCITVLESPVPIQSEFNRVEALRLLVHFVGDIHQPLHCGCGYYRLDDSRHPQLIKNPDQAVGLPSDRGGNGLFFGPNEELHGFWDVGLVEDIATSTDYQVLATYLRARSPAIPVMHGDYHRWAECWALDSVRLADKAYEGIQFNDSQLNGDKTYVQIMVGLPSDYTNTSTPIAAKQLITGAAHLAQLLEKINWP